MSKHNVSFSWDITYKCNYRCPYCWGDKSWISLGRENEYRSVGELMQAWQRIRRMYGQAHIDILGGEPFLYPHFAELIRELSVLHKITITTNLSCSIERIVKECDSANININPTFHPLFCKLNDFLPKARLLLKAGFVKAITYLAYPPQIPQIRFYREIFQKEGLLMSILTFWGKYNGRDYPNSYTQEEKTVISSNLAHCGGEKFQVSPIQSPRGKLCYAGCIYACIHPNGEVIRCGGGGYGGVTEVVGNFFDEKFRLLEGSAPCPVNVCPCNEWAFLLEENINKNREDKDLGSQLIEIVDSPQQQQENAGLRLEEVYLNSVADSDKEQINELQCGNKLTGLMPVGFSWEICYTCNYRCPYCGRWNDASTEDLYLDVLEWEVIWRRIYQKYGSCNIFISGAEPTTYPRFFDIVQKIAMMHTVTICTNFSWVAEEILDTNFAQKRVQVTPTYHSFFADFDSFLAKTISLKQWIKDKMVFFVAYPPQMAKVDYYKRMMNKNGLNFCIVPLRGSKYGSFGVVACDEDKDNIGSITDMSEDEYAYLAQKSSPKGKPCRAGYRYAFIKATGKVFACSQSNICLGNIRESEFALLEELSVCPFDFCPYESYNLLERYKLPDER